MIVPSCSCSVRYGRPPIHPDGGSICDHCGDHIRFEHAAEPEHEVSDDQQELFG